jgi:alanine dehydrogenase
VLIISANELDQLLDWKSLRDAVKTAFIEVSAGRVEMPVRSDLAIPPVDGHLLTMPAYLASSEALTMKMVGVFPRNNARGLPTITGILALYDPTSGSLLALMDAAVLTAQRTAAASAVAADLLARPDSSVLAVIGAGVQARSHLRALTSLRDIREVRVCARRPQSAQSFAADMAAELSLPIRHVAGCEEAIRDADIVIAATTSPQPVVEWSWLRSGVHVCAIGFGTLELAPEVVANADIIAVDTRDGVLAEAEDLKRPIAAGILSKGSIVEVGAILMGSAPGRTSDSEVTVYRSVGMAAMDAAAAALAFRRAQELHLGTSVSL